MDNNTANSLIEVRHHSLPSFVTRRLSIRVFLFPFHLFYHLSLALSPLMHIVLAVLFSNWKKKKKRKRISERERNRPVEKCVSEAETENREENFLCLSMTEDFSIFSNSHIDRMADARQCGHTSTIAAAANIAAIVIFDFHSPLVRFGQINLLA